MRHLDAIDTPDARVIERIENTITRRERKELEKGTGSGGKHEPYQYYGQHAGLPANRRMEGLSGQFGDQYLGALGLQRGMYDQFGDMAAGQGPSLAQSQLQQGMGVAEQSAVNAALQARGGNAAGGQQAALQAATSLGGQAAMDAAQLRQQEQLAAMGAQAGLAGQMAGQGLQGQMGMEGLYQGALANQLNADVTYRLGSRQAREQERQGHKDRQLAIANTASLGIIPGGGNSGVLSDERAKTDVEPATGPQIEAVNPYAYEPTAKEKVGQAGGILGGNLGSILSLAALSDERVKQDLHPGNLQASQAVGELDPYTFQYQAGYGPQGQQIGVMAQDMERAYPSAVQSVQTPEGPRKAINVAQATGLSLAAAAEQEKRLRGVEAALGAQTMTQGNPYASAADSARARISAMDEGQGLAGRPMSPESMDPRTSMSAWDYDPYSMSEINSMRAERRAQNMGQPMPQGPPGGLMAQPGSQQPSGPSGPQGLMRRRY